MKKFITIVLLQSFACLLYAQTDVKSQNNNNSVDCEIGEVDGQEERCEDDQLSLLRNPSYGKVEVSWYLSGPPSWSEPEEDTAKTEKTIKEFIAELMASQKPQPRFKLSQVTSPINQEMLQNKP